MANGTFKMKMDIDRHSPRSMPNNCKNFNPPNFSLPTTFKLLFVMHSIPLFWHVTVHLSCMCLKAVTHKVLTYIEYRAVSGVFRTIDPPPPLHSASVSSPCTKGGGYIHTRRAVRGWGVNISEDARHWIGLLQYNPSTLSPACLRSALHVEK
jgi:hypothetical protein